VKQRTPAEKTDGSNACSAGSACGWWIVAARRRLQFPPRARLVRNFPSGRTAGFCAGLRPSFGKTAGWNNDIDSKCFLNIFSGRGNYARPHPGPLPRGEGEAIIVAGRFGRPGCSLRASGLRGNSAPRTKLLATVKVGCRFTLPMNPPVAQTFLSAGSRDILVPCCRRNGPDWRLESRQDPQTGMSAPPTSSRAQGALKVRSGFFWGRGPG
jgi:hypothetical protein